MPIYWNTGTVSIYELEYNHNYNFKSQLNLVARVYRMRNENILLEHWNTLEYNLSYKNLDLRLCNERWLSCALPELLSADRVL